MKSSLAGGRGCSKAPSALAPRSVACLVFIQLMISAYAGVEPYMVKDINPGALDSNPVPLADANGNLFVTAYQSPNYGIYQSDGTEPGTGFIASLPMGIASSSYGNGANSSGIYYFQIARYPTSGGLWKTDWTPNGTTKIADMAGIANYMIDINGKIFYSLSEAGALFVNDGTALGTRQIIKFPFMTKFYSLMNLNGKCYFICYDALGVTDGTDEGTAVVADFNNIYNKAISHSLLVHNGCLLFPASDIDHGMELWKSDGTGPGTVLLKDITPGTASSFNVTGFHENININGTLYFTAGASYEQIWKTDGTEAGTQLVKDGISATYFTNVNGMLFFVYNGNEIWKSDGTDAGTTFVKHFDNPYPSIQMTFNSMVNANGMLYAYLSIPKKNIETDRYNLVDELWKSDGTPEGTLKIGEFEYNSLDAAWGRCLYGVNNLLFFENKTGEYGRELWCYNPSGFPDVGVFDGASQIPNGGGPIDLGTAGVGSTPALSKTFTIKNTGLGVLVTSNVVAPAGYTITKPLSNRIPAFQSDTLTIALTAATTGTFAGQITFETDAPGQPVFQFSVTGALTDPPGIAVFDGGIPIADGGGPVDFGSASYGLPALSKTFTVRNTGVAPLSILNFSVPIGYSIISTPSGSIPGGGADTFSVALATTMPGTLSGAITFDTNIPGQQSFSFFVAGTITAPAVVVLDGATTIPNGGGPVNLGSASQNKPSPRKYFTVVNTGTEDLDLSNPIASAGFSLPDPLPASIAPGTSGAFAVAFLTSAPGALEGSVSFNTNAPFTPTFSLSLAATVTAPAMTVLDGATTIAYGGGPVSFGQANMEEPALTKSFTVRNTGTEDLITSNLSAPAGYAITAPLSARIPAGGSSGFTLVLSTATTGVFTGAVTFETNVPSRPLFLFHVSGTITAPDLAVREGDDILPDDGSALVDFGATYAGGAALSKTFTVSNPGSGMLTVSALSVPPNYSILEPLSVSIPAGGSDSFILALPTDTSGTFAGQVRFNTNVPWQPSFAFFATGTVTAPPGLAVLDGATTIPNHGGLVDFGVANVNASTLTKTFTVINTGGWDLLTSGLGVPANYSVAAPLAGRISPGAISTFTLALSTAAGGVFPGDVSFNTNVPGQPTFGFHVTGTIAAPAIAVFDGDAPLANWTGQVDFGAVSPGDPRPVKTITVKNPGMIDLITSNLSAPAGYSVLEPLEARIPAGGQAGFTVALGTDATGTFAGQIAFDTNVPGQPSFAFNVTGSVSTWTDYYKALYKKPGAPQKELIATAGGAIEISGGTEKDTLKIVWKRGKSKTTPPPVIPRVATDGGLRVFSTVAPILALETAKDIGSLSATKSYVKSIAVGGVIRSARMTWLLPGVSAQTEIVTSGALARGKASVQMSGVILRRLAAPRQDFSTILSSTKRTALGITPGGIFGQESAASSQTASRDIDIRSAASLSAAGGDIRGIILARGAIGSIKAVSIKRSGSQTGGSIGTTSATAGAVNSAAEGATDTLVMLTQIAAGFIGSEGPPASGDGIGLVFASKSINACLIAGAEDKPASGTALQVTPSCAGVVKTLNMAKGGTAHGAIYMNPSAQGLYPKPYPDPANNRKFQDSMARCFAYP